MYFVKFDLHSNMFLLIPRPAKAEVGQFLDLHSNMFLLILKGENYGLLSSPSIYIPICFY